LFIGLSVFGSRNQAKDHGFVEGAVVLSFGSGGAERL